MDVNVGGDDEPLDVLDRELPQRMRAESDQRSQISLFATGMAGELERMRPLDDVLRSAATAAADVVWILTSPEVHHMLLTTRGWTRSLYETWLRETLERAQLPDATGGAG